MSSAVRAPSPTHGVRALLLALLVACGFATNSALARIAYEAGSNAITLLTVRTATALLVLLVLLRVCGIDPRLPRRRTFGALALGLLSASYSYGLLGSIQFVPLAVALVTFYTYPLLTALLSAALGRERVGALTFAMLLIALYGLSLVLNVEGAHLDPIGIAHALGASVCFTALLLLSDSVRAGGDSRPVTLHMLVTTIVVYLGACLATGSFALPNTTLGWVGFVGCPIFFSVAFITLFEAVRLGGPVRSALVLNVEPVASAMLGYLLLDQLLEGWQMVGIALVVGAVVVARLPAAMGRAPPDVDRATAGLLVCGLAFLLAALASL